MAIWTVPQIGNAGIATLQTAGGLTLGDLVYNTDTQELMTATTASLFENVGRLDDGEVTTDKIFDNAVTADKLFDIPDNHVLGNVGMTGVDAGPTATMVETRFIADLAVTSGKIQNAVELRSGPTLDSNPTARTGGLTIATTQFVRDESGNPRIVLSETDPASPEDGNLWFDSSDDMNTSGRLYVYSNEATAWLDASPSGAGIGRVPVGAVMPFAISTVPDGWLECDGSDQLRATYVDLFAAIGDIYGAGDGTTTFTLPDLRGEFIRGYDHGAGNDPDAASRTDRGDGTAGDEVGTKQVSAFGAHTHTFDAGTGTDAGGNTGVAANAAGTTGSTGGTETRPRNVYMMYCIRT